MRILHVLDHSLPLQSGYAMRTLAILREQRARGWSTVQLTTPRQNAGDVDADDVAGFRIHRTPLAARGRTLGVATYVREMLATERRIDALLDRYPVDVLHAHSPVLDVIPALRVGRRRALPVVYELRATWEDAAVDHGTTVEGSLRYRASRMLETFALHRADHVTTICEGLREEIVARGVSPERVTVVPNAVDTNAFAAKAQPGEAALRRRLSLDDSEVIGFAGSFYGYEGLDLLIEASSRLARRRPHLKVLLVGGGPQASSLEALVAARGLADRVVFTGRVPHEDVHAYYDLIDVLVYPRRSVRLTELVTPLKPLEAMAQGRMLIASDVGGHRELVRDGETGYLFRAGDVEALVETIDRVLRERDRWPAVAARARRFVETERTWARSAAAYVDVYRAVTQPKNAAVAAQAHGKR
ncbi:MAG TPA: TIGR04063 family PEP-CTERM/XrtA system glycosyltransferase [Casimicrobiaceae bacterium]|nr:TIGR04063 family PEP-CTERM/XrtA system glycosyltransferase [Casimicrobiaceae bacterium]